MILQEKLEQANSFHFFASENIEKGPDVSGLRYDTPEIGREAFREILESTEKGFIRVSIYLLDNSLRLIINDLKNRHIVTVNNLFISSEDLTDLKSAYASHREFSFAFAILPNSGRLEIYPITEHAVALTVKSWEIIEY